MTQKIQNPWTFDVRVRERNLKSGHLQDKEVEKYLAALPDLADQAEPFAIAQPALEQPELPEEEDDEEESAEEEVPVAAAAEPAPPVAEAPVSPTGDGSPIE